MGEGGELGAVGVVVGAVQRWTTESAGKMKAEQGNQWHQVERALCRPREAWPVNTVIAVKARVVPAEREEHPPFDRPFGIQGATVSKGNPWAR